MLWHYWPSIRSILGCVLDGVFDSLRLPSTLIFFLSSVTVRVRTAHCIILNGLIFLGSIFIGDWLLAPLLRTILALSGISSWKMSIAAADIPLPAAGAEGEQYVGEWMSVFFLYAYQLLWVYPLYAISFILNALFYQDIADHAFITHGGAHTSNNTTFQKWVATMSDEVYRLLLVTAYMIQMTLVSFLPFGIGNVLVIMHLCWLYALYSFEYKWSLLGWSLEYRLKYFERHWAYFLGFGLPAVILSLVFPKFISLGMFALCFPIFIILAIIAQPTTHVPKLKKKDKEKTEAAMATATVTKKHTLTKAPAAEAPVLFAQLPIFRVATWINWRILSKLQSASKSTTRRPSISMNTTASAAAPAADPQ